MNCSFVQQEERRCGTQGISLYDKEHENPNFVAHMQLSVVHTLAAMDATTGRCVVESSVVMTKPRNPSIITMELWVSPGTRTHTIFNGAACNALAAIDATTGRVQNPSCYKLMQIFPNVAHKNTIVPQTIRNQRRDQLGPL